MGANNNNFLPKIITTTLLDEHQWLLTTDQQLISQLEELEAYSLLVKKLQAYEFTLAEDSNGYDRRNPKPE